MHFLPWVFGFQQTVGISPQFFLKNFWRMVLIRELGTGATCVLKKKCLHGELSRIGEAARSSSNFSLSSVYHSVLRCVLGLLLYNCRYIKNEFILKCVMKYIIRSKEKIVNGSCMKNPFFPIDLCCLDLWTFMENSFTATKRRAELMYLYIFLCWTKLFCTLKRRMASESSLCISSNDSSMKKMMMPLCMSC